MSDDLTTLRAAAEAEQPGPWHVDTVDYYAAPVLAYLVAAANAAPGLVAEVERLWDERDRARIQADEWRDQFHVALAEVARLTQERDGLRRLIERTAQEMTAAGFSGEAERIRRDGGLTSE